MNALPYSPKTSPAGIRPVIIDTDMGSDDWPAIILLLGCKRIAVLAMTVTGVGISHLEPGARNLLNLASAAGKGGIPVALGASKLRRPEREFPSEWRIRADRFLDIALPKSDTQPVGESAAEAIIRIVQDNREPVDIVALGPLTNISDALELDRSITDNIGTIYIMGGALNVPGNAPGQTAEWNFYIDPSAASAVFHSGCKITLVPLDVTNQAPVTIDFYNRLVIRDATPAARLITNILTAEMEEILSGEYFFWDSVAAAAVIDSDLVRLEKLPVLILDDSSPYAGASKIDSEGTIVTVCTSVDRTSLENLLIETVG